MFHRASGPAHWANARLVRYADDFVVMARYQGARIEEWLAGHLEEWLGLTINREKTSVVRLHQTESLDFLGFTFRFDRDLLGRGHRYLNAQPSKKSLAKAREAIRAKTRSAEVLQAEPGDREGTQHLPARMVWLLQLQLSPEGVPGSRALCPGANDHAPQPAQSA